MPRAVLEAATGASRVRPIPVSASDADASERPHSLGRPRIAHLVDRLSALLETSCSPASPVRICVPALGSPQWGDLEAQVRCVKGFTCNIFIYHSHRHRRYARASGHPALLAFAARAPPPPPVRVRRDRASARHLRRRVGRPGMGTKTRLAVRCVDHARSIHGCAGPTALFFYPLGARGR